MGHALGIKRPSLKDMTERGDIVLAAFWAHARRKFYGVHEATGSGAQASSPISLFGRRAKSRGFAHEPLLAHASQPKA